ncbi:hypothetical protein Pmani_014968 [Petrolisthes manimaculis]|uniref:Methyltransferase FkbM domain-containing protein n=1 Tax=Petrolisthes manimaculis TaxID=1843537 RepID=A0AAE1PUJ4_9EUCA|nr:hypothetical protein Pmani_014968 [Petrolisthes manimaculis]
MTTVTWRTKLMRKVKENVVVVVIVYICLACGTWAMIRGKFKYNPTSPSSLEGRTWLVEENLPAHHHKVLETLRSTQFLLQPPSTLPYNLTQDSYYVMTSRIGQYGGFFLEAGALDGQQMSNTLWLEQHMNWTGLLIEPNSYNFKHLMYKHRRAWTSNSCISSNALTKRTIHVSKQAIPRTFIVRWHMKGSSYELGHGFSEEKNLPPDTQLWKNIGEDSYHLAHCFPFYSYLLALNVTTIDLLSLDTEGSEVDIIKTIPWESVKVRVLLVEMQPVGDYKTKTVHLVDYMKNKGFRLLAKRLDFIFVREDDSALKTLFSFKDWNSPPKT